MKLAITFLIKKEGFINFSNRVCLTVKLKLVDILYSHTFIQIVYKMFNNVCKQFAKWAYFLKPLLN